ncbi:AraC family transcriptional regulator [Povalibacter sp.]|uniref:AraC family transcriptional regulator n=1 Tax=Povalibacter sp. TaxID=1962978 RepID=UPI002F41B00F
MELVRTLALAGYSQTTRSLGIDPQEILRSVGLSEATIESSRYGDMIELQQVKKILRLTAKAAQCEHFGVLFGSKQSISALGDLGLAMKQAANVQAALEILITNNHLLWQNTATWRIEVFGDKAYIILSFASLKDVRYLAEATLAATFKLVRYFCGKSFTPQQVHIAHSAPKDRAPYRKLFSCSVQFDREEYALVFPERFLRQNIATSDKELAETLQRYLKVMEAHYPADTLAKINYLMERALTFGNCSADNIALMLSMHRRTLHRTLLKHGTTFTALLEQCRRKKARFLLQDTQLQITQIATNLGYSDLTAFNHAFKKWHGMPPTEYRKRRTARRSTRTQH